MDHHNRSASWHFFEKDRDAALPSTHSAFFTASVVLAAPKPQPLKKTQRNGTVDEVIALRGARSDQFYFASRDAEARKEQLL